MSSPSQSDLEGGKLTDATESTSYGSVDNTRHRTSSSDEDDDNESDSMLPKSRRDSIHKIAHSNIMLSVRPTTTEPLRGMLLQRQPSLADHCATVPTELQENTRLVTDPTLEPNEPGALYMALDSYYNSSVEPKYALTVHDDLYANVLGEMDDAHSIPCGMYFCCHGGDSAHTGVSHDDYVDIRIAWALAATFLTVIVSLG